jgi:GT2 family glycosyltransferase
MSAILPADLQASLDPQGPGGAAAIPRLFRLPAGLLLLDLPGGAEGDGRLEVLVDGAPLPPPGCSLRLGAAPRLLVLARDPRPIADLPAVALRQGARMLAEGLRPEGEAGFLDAAAALAPGDAARLLGFLAGTGAPLFRLSGDAGLAGLLHQLALSLAGPGAARPMTRVGAGGSLWFVPGEAPRGPWHLLTPARLRRVAAPLGGTMMLDGTLRQGLLLPPPGPDGAVRPIRLAAPRGSLPGLLEASGASEDRSVLRALGRRAALCPAAAGLLRDRRLLAPGLQPRLLDDPARPIGGAVELALADGAGGVFLAGWLRDPMGLSHGLALRDPLTGASLPVPESALHWIARPDLAERLGRAPHGGPGTRPGFVAHLPAAGGAVAQWGLDIRLGSGESIGLTAPPGLLPAAAARDLVLRAVHPAALRTEVLDGCLAPAVARLHRAALDGLGAPEVVEIGRPPARPGVAIVIPLYRNLRFLRFQLAAFAADAALRRTARLVFVLDSPEQRAEVEHLLRGLHAVHGLPMTLVTMAANAGYSSASNAGARAAEGAPLLLMLNSDVVPDAPGWLAPLAAPLRRDRRVLATGPKLLFEDGSVQHAGLFFARHGAEGDWLNGHYAKGLPRHHPSATRPRAVPGVTGAALLVRAEAFRAVGGFSTDYVVGDYEDSDLCLRLRALGGEIRYVPEAELFHFERQSIVGHGGYARTLASAHNRRLHHLRWDRDIAALMRRFGGAA